MFEQEVCRFTLVQRLNLNISKPSSNCYNVFIPTICYLINSILIHSMEKLIYTFLVLAIFSVIFILILVKFSEYLCNPAYSISLATNNRPQAPETEKANLYHCFFSPLLGLQQKGGPQYVLGNKYSKVLLSIAMTFKRHETFLTLYQYTLKKWREGSYFTIFKGKISLPSKLRWGIEISTRRFLVF